MARAFDAATLALLDGNSLVERDLLVVALPEGTFGYWSDVYDAQFSRWPGVTFTGSASLISATPITQSITDQVQTTTITLSGLATDVLARIGSLSLHQGRIEIAKALMNPDDLALVTVAVVMRGFIDRDELVEADGKSEFRLTCVSRARELDRATNRTRSFADQAADYPGDRGFEFAKKTGTTKIMWGANQASGSQGSSQPSVASVLQQTFGR